MTKREWVKWWNTAEDSEDPSDPDYRKLGQDIWNVFDVDGNGTMSEEEFLLYVGVNEFGSLKQRLLSSFLLADRNGDGHLTKKEIRVMFNRMMRMKKRGEVPGPQAKKVASKLIPADKERVAYALDRFLAVADRDNVSCFSSHCCTLLFLFSLVACLLVAWQSGRINLQEFMAAADKNPELFDLFGVVA